MFNNYKNILQNKLLWLYIFTLLVGFLVFTGINTFIFIFIMSIGFVRYLNRLGYTTISKTSFAEIDDSGELVDILTQTSHYTEEELGKIDLYITDSIEGITARTSSDIWGNYIILPSFIIELLQPEEVASIIAHELGHIDADKSKEVKTYTYITTVLEISMGVIILYSLTFFIQGLIFILPLYIIYGIVDSHRSRLEEYIADEYAVSITGDSPLLFVLGLLQNQTENSEQKYDQTINVGITTYKVNDHPHPQKRIQYIKNKL